MRIGQKKGETSKEEINIAQKTRNLKPVHLSGKQVSSCLLYVFLI